MIIRENEQDIWTICGIGSCRAVMGNKKNRTQRRSKKCVPDGLCRRFHEEGSLFKGKRALARSTGEGFIVAAVASKTSTSALSLILRRHGLSIFEPIRFP
jgi:hypothetical protein